ncbi:MAG: histidine phosphatase family protein [Planctomycetota bacterium]
MKTLYLVRHAKTEKNSSTNQDFDRVLLPKGTEDAHRIAKQFRETHPIPEILITSSANRALETAQIFAQEFGFPLKQIQIHQELYETTSDDFISFLQDFQTDWTTVMIFGHNPVLEEVIPLLLKKSQNPPLPPGTTVGISLNIQHWHDRILGKGELLFLYNPKSE